MGTSQVASPFDTIESSIEFVLLLEDSIKETLVDVGEELDEAMRASDERRCEALQLVTYKINQLSMHVGKSRRLLNDLRMLRRLILQERSAKASSGAR